MNLKKNLLVVALAASFAVPSFASTTSVPADPTNVNVRSDIKKMIQRMDLDYSKYQLESVKLKFMVNENDELIIISTGDSVLDTTLKNGLNYKHVDTEGLKPYSIYVVQVTLKKT